MFYLVYGLVVRGFPWNREKRKNYAMFNQSLSSWLLLCSILSYTIFHGRYCLLLRVAVFQCLCPTSKSLVLPFYFVLIEDICCIHFTIKYTPHRTINFFSVSWGPLPTFGTLLLAENWWSVMQNTCIYYYHLLMQLSHWNWLVVLFSVFIFCFVIPSHLQNWLIKLCYELKVETVFTHSVDAFVYSLVFYSIFVRCASFFFIRWAGILSQFSHCTLLIYIFISA